MKVLVVLYLILLVGVERSFAFDTYEDYFDPVLDYLLNGNDTEISELHDKNNDKLDADSPPVFQDGIWKCGNCNEINEKRLIYNEINDVDTNIDEDNFLQVQVGLAFDEMRCVTIQSDEENYQVKRISGACTGPTVTLYVSNAQHFDKTVQQVIKTLRKAIKDFYKPILHKLKYPLLGSCGSIGLNAIAGCTQKVFNRSENKNSRYVKQE